MAGINFEVDDLLGRDAAKKRQQEAAVLAQNLLQHGADPDSVNQIANDYASTGKINLPGMMKKMLPASEDDPSTPRSTMVPFALDQKKKGLYGFNTQTGKFQEQQTPEDMTDFEVKSYTPTKPTTQGYTIYVNDQTGDEIRREPNNSGKDQIIRITPPKPNGARAGGAGKDPPDIALAKDTMKKYQAALLKGDEIPDAFMDSARSAADRLNIDMNEVEKDPSMLDSVLNTVSQATGGAVPPAKKKFGATSPRYTPKTGKPLTKDAAQQFLQQAQGDKNKARTLAKAAGYTF